MRPPASRPRRAGALGAVGPGLVVLLAFVSIVSSCDLAVNLNNLEGGCAPAKHGTSQVKITSGPAPFCIDSTEVTNAQYADFLAASYALPASATPPGCVGTTDLTPSNDWLYPPGDDLRPVSYVNWCQAFTFCAWAGKRLCGKIKDNGSDAGALAATSFHDPTQSQWLNACTRGGAITDYPYGGAFDESACGGAGLSDAASTTTEPVRYRPRCVGGTAGVYDMSGNVWEWTDACASDDPGAFCDAMGGGFDSQPTELECGGERNWTRTSGAANIGIRCCLDL